MPMAGNGKEKMTTVARETYLATAALLIRPPLNLALHEERSERPVTEFRILMNAGLVAGAWDGVACAPRFSSLRS